VPEKEISLKLHLGIKVRINSGNISYHSIRNTSSSHLLSKNVKVKIHKMALLTVVLYMYETRAAKIKEEHRVTMYYNRVLIRRLGPKSLGRPCHSSGG
jgi:hypothetical protein